LKRAVESLEPRCPVIAMSEFRLGSTKIRTNQSLWIPLGSSEVHAFARRAEDQVEIRWQKSQRHNQRL
jgi:hypothetical protein